MQSYRGSRAIAIIIFAVSILSGCSAGGILGGYALMKYPAASAELHLEDSKYFVFTARLLIRNDEKTIKHVWHCKHKRYFTTRDMKWHLKWEPSQNSFLRIDKDGRAIYVKLPKSCEITDGDEYRPRIGFVENSRDADLVKSFSGEELNGISQEIQLIDGRISSQPLPAQDTEMSSKEARLWQRLKTNVYQTVIAVVFSEEGWRENPRLSQSLDKYNKITLSGAVKPEPRRYTPWFPGYLDFTNNREAVEKSRHDVYLGLLDDEWVFVEDNHVIYYLDSMQTSLVAPLNPSLINYQGRIFDYERDGPQLYDPLRKRLITFTQLSL